MTERRIFEAHENEQSQLLKINEELSQIVGGSGLQEASQVTSSLAFDNYLQKLAGEIRATYLQGLSAITSRRWRTPPDGIAMPFPGDDTPYSYTYDRQHPPKPLEMRLNAGGSSDVVLCSSGMASLNVVFQSLNFLMDSSNTLAVFASYFETLSLLRICPFSQRFVRANSESELSEIIADEQVGVVLVEPVHYNWALSTTFWPDILTSLAARDDPPFVILDTTLTGVCSAQTELLSQLRSVVPVVICVRSGIKLDQKGLELTNLGVVEIYCADTLIAEKIAATVRKCRSICGATLTWQDACALAPRVVCTPSSVCEYGHAVFNNARELFDRLKNVGGLFKRVSHPEPPWPAPLVILELADGGSENYRELATILDVQQRKRGLNWQMSGSFGFRTQRFETILPEELLRSGESHAGALKIASGCYAGARHHAILEIIEELAAYPDLQTAKYAMGKSYNVGKAQ